MPSDVPTDRARVLFVCIENSNRSQMAEAFAHMMSDERVERDERTDRVDPTGGREDRAGRVEAYSAGSAPSGAVNPRAIASMREVGYDLSTHRSTALSALPAHEWDAVVTMGCGDDCPAIPARRREDWPIPDPRDMAPEEFARVRDTIRAHVEALLTDLLGDRSP